MKKHLFLSIILVSTLLINSCKQNIKSEPSEVQTDSSQIAMTDYLQESKEDKNARMKWWREAKFGMFIHWGLYAIPAGVYQGKEVKGIGEWIMNKAPIPVAEYEKYAAEFNPVKFDAEEWVNIAKSAGMKYIVITSKHHDGFGLWDSKVSDYDIMDASPYQKDILKALSEACKKEGITLCFYHSIMDWHHPDAQGPFYPKYNDKERSNPNFGNYAENYMIPQIKELVSQYDPAVMWFDGEWIPEWTEPQGKALYNMIRNMKPEILINNRVGKGRQGMQGMNKDNSYVGDFGTPEQEILEGTADVDWESCMTMNKTWGFKKNDDDWKSSEMLIHNLIDIAAKGGNYLLNVGPTAEGLIPNPSVERLADMGKWLEVNGEAIYATHALKNYKEGESIRFTQSNDKANTVYVFSLEIPKEKLVIKSIQAKADSEIKLLGYENSLEWNDLGEEGFEIIIPEDLKEEANSPSDYAWTFQVETN